MNAEDVERLWSLATAVNNCSIAPLPEQLAKLEKFASLVERETVAMCKEKLIVTGTTNPEEYLDWSAVDAMVKR